MSLIVSDEVVKASGLSEDQRLIADRIICVHHDVAEFQEDIGYLTAKGLL